MFKKSNEPTADKPVDKNVGVEDKLASHIRVVNVNFLQRADQAFAAALAEIGNLKAEINQMQPYVEAFMLLRRVLLPAPGGVMTADVRHDLHDMQQRIKEVMEAAPPYVKPPVQPTSDEFEEQHG